MKKSYSYILLILSLTLMVSCLGKTAPSPQIENVIVMVTDVGGVNDQSFNQSAWEGLTLLSKEMPGTDVRYYESKTEADYAPFIQNAVDSAAGLIWGIGYKLAPAVQEASENFPDQKFAIIDYTFDPTLPNVSGVAFRVQEAAYLAGYLAAKVTKTKKIGFIGGFETPIIDHFEYGFRAGVLAADPHVQVFTQYAASFTDSDKGKSIAQTMADSGIDIIFPVAVDAGNGAIELVRERGLYAIGVDRDQSYLAPNQMLTSVLKRVDQATYSISRNFLEGNFSAGTVELGLADDAVGLAPVNPKIVQDQQLLSTLETLRGLILSAEIKIPKSKEEFLAMGYPLNK